MCLCVWKGVRCVCVCGGAVQTCLHRIKYYFPPNINLRMSVETNLLHQLFPLLSPTCSAALICILHPFSFWGGNCCTGVYQCILNRPSRQLWSGSKECVSPRYCETLRRSPPTPSFQATSSAACETSPPLCKEKQILLWLIDTAT